MPRTAAEILHDARWMAGLTQAEVAQRAGVSQQMIALYERGKKQPSFATLAALVAGCGVELTTHLLPRPGLEDQPTLELLGRPVHDRVPEPYGAALSRVADSANGLPLIIGGKAAARLHGAVVQLPELELWLPDDIDLGGVTAFLGRLDAAEVGLYSGASTPVAEPQSLAEGWGLAGPGVDLQLRTVPDFAQLRRRARRLTLTTGHALSYADPYDATAWWHPRDLSHLALQRALRLAEDNRSDVSGRP